MTDQYSNDPFAPQPVVPEPVQPAQQSVPQRAEFETEPAPAAYEYQEPQMPIKDVPPDVQPEEPAFFEDDDVDVRRAVLKVVAVVFVLLAATGGGVWYYLSRDEGGSKTPTASEARDPNLILASKGGKITTKDGFEVIIPAGALAKDTKIEVEKVEGGRVTDLYHLKPDGLKFLKQVTLAIPYKPAGLKENETPYDIRLNYWLTRHGDTRMLEYTLEEDDKKLRTKVSEF